MATGGLLTFRDNGVYIGAAKQAAWGTDVAPTWFYRWLDGTDANPQTKISFEREGDGSGDVVLDYKEEQHGVLKIVEYGRPFLAGYALQSLHGTASDTYSAPTANTTLSGGVVVGATACPVVANLGNIGTLPVVVTAGYASTGWEVVTLDLTTRTGTGPWTYTLANAATFAKAHSSSDAVISAAGHAFTRKYTFDPYCFEVGYGNDPSNPTQIIRYIDGVCADLTIESSTGKPVKFTHTWYTTAIKKMAAGTALSIETSNAFRHFDASAAWNLNSVATGNAATIKSSRVQFKRSVNVNDCQSEGVTPVYFLPGNYDVSGDLMAEFNSWNDYNLMYFGATSPATGAKDSNLVGESQFSVTYSSDAVNSLAISVPTIGYSATPLKQSLRANGMQQPIRWTARKAVGATTPATVTLNNTQVGAY